jgi:exopolysaccharide biosynthesis polyprenyl glycosylphosphotransferase
MILNRRSRGVELMHCITQIVTAIVLYVVWLSLPWELAIGKSWGGFTNYTAYGLFCVMGLAAYYWRSAERPLLDLTFSENLHTSLRQIAMVFVFIVTYISVAKDHSISRIFLFTYIPVLGAALFVTNSKVPDLIRRVFFRGTHDQNTLLLGRAVRSGEMAQWIEQKRRYGVNVVTSLSTDCLDSASAQEAADLLDQVRSLAMEHRINQVICLEHPGTLDRFRDLLTVCEQLGLRLLVIADWEAEVGRKAIVGEDGGHVIMSFFDEPLQCPWNRVLKRLFDLAIAIPVVAFILPLVALVVWFAQRAQAPGPLLFRQKRSGASGRLFDIYKFRTMVVDNPDESRQASVDDPRIFAFGRWLRRMSLDELPQFINVLHGDMSVIGPRPHLPAHDEIFSPAARWYRARQLVKPGITGLAQVSGYRGETRTTDDVNRRIEADLEYLERWSFPMDCLILARTIWQVLSPPKSAY